MARIGSYPIDAVIQDKDAWIGTENTNRVTRQFTALGVAEYIDTKNVGLVFVGATNLLPGKKGLVPAPLAGQEGMFLKGDLGGGWTTIPVYTLDVPVGTTNVNLINTDGAGAIINSFITLTGGTYLTSVHTSGSQITFNHDDTVRTDPAKPTPTPAPGATLDLVSAVASNATGHVTGVTTSTVTWPADSDTTYTIDVPNDGTTSINLKGSDGTNDPIAFTTLAGNNGMTISRTNENILNFNSKWQINNVNQDGYVPKGTANANKFWATDGNGNPGWTFQPSQDQTITTTGTTNASTGIVLSQNGGTVIVKGDGSTISASSDNTTNVITLAAINRVNTTYTLPVAAGAANTAVINLTDNSAVVSSVTFNGTANKIAISETVGNNGDITIGMPDDVTVTGDLTVSGGNIVLSNTGRIQGIDTVTAGTDAASKAYVDGLVSGGLTFRGTFNAATGEILSGVSSGSQLYNCPGGAGTRIAVAVGDYYIVATAGGSFYCSGATLDIGDSIIATAAAGADASVVTGWSVVQSDEGVASFTNANGTFVSAGTANTNATGAVTMGTIDLSATGTKNGTTFLRGDNTWAVPAYVSYSAMTTSTLGLGKIKYDNNSTPAANSQSTTTARTYGVTKNASDQLVVNVPWLNTSDVNSVTAIAPDNATSGIVISPTTGSVIVGLDINSRTSIGVPASDDELMIYDKSIQQNQKVLVSDLAQYVGDGTAAANQVTYWTSANAIGGGAGFTFAGGANGAVTMGGALTVSGNVGIGAAPADGNLSVKTTGVNTGITNVLMNLNLVREDNTTGLSVGYRTDETTAVFAPRTTTGNIAFYNYDGGWGETARFTNTRKLVLGRASAYGSGKTQSFIDHTANFASPSFLAGDSANMAAGVGGEITFVGKYAAGVDDYAFYGGIKGFKENATGSNTACSLGFYTRASGTLPTLALTINSSQNSTFAGTVETTTLRTDVINNKANSANIIYRSGTNTIVGGGISTAKVYIQDGGNVGISENAPATLLSLKSPLANKSIITLKCSKNDSSWTIGDRIGGIDFFGEDGSGQGAGIKGSINYIVTSSSGGSNAMTFNVAGTANNQQALRIRGTGCIGIGSDGFDSQKLTIAAGALDGAIYATSTDANCFASFRDVNSNQNIEYGAVGNDHILRKDGATYFVVNNVGDVYNYQSVNNANTLYGYHAGKYTSTGASNSAFGYSALYGLTSGTSNVAIGRSALQDLTVGTNNVAIGLNAGKGGDFGASVFIGHEAGESNSYSNNVGIGHQSLYTCGNSYNTALGWNSGRSISSGSRNVALGSASMENGGVTGNDNVGVGHYTLNALSSGSENSTIGSYAGQKITTGVKNICIGHQAGENITDGASNTVIGVNAGDSLVSADNNVILGRLAYQAGDNASNVVIGIQAGYANNGAENVFVGGYAGRSATISNTVAIGYSALYNCTANANVAIGQQAAEATTSGAGNTAVGYHALKNNTTGNANVAIGQQALTGSTDAAYSVVIGHEAGYGVTTGDYNVLVGDRAGRVLAAGAENTLIGAQTGYDLTGGNYNTCIGFKNLFAATSADFNTSMGFAALNQSTTSENAAFGAYAMHYSTSAQNGAAFGFKALFSQTTAEGNTAFGFQCMEAASTGAKNTAVGRSAGDSISTGSEHTVLGYSAGDELTTGSNCIAIGFAAGSGSSPRQMTTNSNEIVIGNNSIVGAYVRVAWTVGSDKRDKINFSNVPHGLDFVNKLKPTSYDLRKERDSDETIGERKYGFIAQEVLELEGDNPVIIDDSDENKLAIQDSNLIPILVNAIQELKAEIEILKNK